MQCEREPNRGSPCEAPAVNDRSMPKKTGVTGSYAASGRAFRAQRLRKPV